VTLEWENCWDVLPGGLLAVNYGVYLGLLLFENADNSFFSYFMFIPASCSLRRRSLRSLMRSSCFFAIILNWWRALH
jgi:hypothetical protein